ncbi:Piso0_001971 [Millerozyma farinosa CBS 7064]|uniref:Piso0_001971 protein n=1 Tax=Pichia sorbitophila (strain ATCC MYA-4447 / BCRC 22081 / CBS 7064 / NBRC 10061 / NRRL Y-12695) TaxID=559304 RepID=G8YBC3_PICSO|nr:Piso0_001971 [Millerozyma farinosa CBS 7064]
MVLSSANDIKQESETTTGNLEESNHDHYSNIEISMPPISSELNSMPLHNQEDMTSSRSGLEEEVNIYSQDKSSSHAYNISGPQVHLKRKSSDMSVLPEPPLSTKESSAAATKQQGPLGHQENPRTLWMGDLDPWLDETAIADLWYNVLKKRVNVKLIRPRSHKTDFPYHGVSHLGYCFVEFDNLYDAQLALSLNGKPLPQSAMPSQKVRSRNQDNQKKYFRLNWANGATLDAPIIHTPEFSLFVGDLSASTTEAHLLAFFQNKYPESVKTVRVITDPVSGKSRCFGFVRFSDEHARSKALVEMQGTWFGGRQLRVALASAKTNAKTGNTNGSPGFYNVLPQHFFQAPGGLPLATSPFGYYGNSQLHPQSQYPALSSSSEALNSVRHHGHSVIPDSISSYNGTEGLSNNLYGIHHGQPFADPKNTTVFVGGLSAEVNDQTLFALFKPFGIIQQVKIPPGKNCGFIKYSKRQEAEDAIASMQGFIIGGNRVRLSWGKVSTNNKKFNNYQQQMVQAAQMQVAAAMSMGLGPNNAMAAAAAAAAGYNTTNSPFTTPPHLAGPAGHAPGVDVPLARGISPIPLQQSMVVPPPAMTVGHGTLSSGNSGIHNTNVPEEGPENPHSGSTIQKPYQTQDQANASIENNLSQGIAALDLENDNRK